MTPPTTMDCANKDSLSLPQRFGTESLFYIVGDMVGAGKFVLTDTEVETQREKGKLLLTLVLLIRQ